MNDDYNPLEARLLKYSNTPEIISQSNTIPITCINLLQWSKLYLHQLGSPFPGTHVFGAADIIFSNFFNYNRVFKARW